MALNRIPVFKAVTVWEKLNNKYSMNVCNYRT